MGSQAGVGAQTRDGADGRSWKGAVITGVATVLAAVIMVVGGWLDYRGPGSASPQESPTLDESVIPAIIVSPTEGELVDRCASVRGVAPPGSNNDAYWLVTRGPSADHDFWLIDRATPATGRPEQWDVAATIGDVEDVDLRFTLLLVRTGEFLTGDYADRLDRNDRNLGKELPPEATDVDHVGVFRTRHDNC